MAGYRLSEPSRAQAFLDAIKLNLDEVYTRCSIYQSKEDLYAAESQSLHEQVSEAVSKRLLRRSGRRRC